MTKWKNCKNVLCVRPDNMGDLLMSSPAIAALKETFQCHLTVLTSSMAKPVTACIPAIDDVMVWDVPWVKGTAPPSYEQFEEVVKEIRSRAFDAAVIFTVFSQNPLPTAMMLTIAGIPRRLAYCRENPYHLLTHWIPDPEPYRFIRHQVQRDLDLVKAVGAHAKQQNITIRLPQNHEPQVRTKLNATGLDAEKPWLLLHPGVSDKKREYPADLWIEAGRKIVDGLKYQVIVTGSAAERELAETIAKGIGPEGYSLAGALSLEEFITLIRFSPLILSVNTVSIHLAAALETKVIVLYALTNPQHTPWKAMGKILPFSVPENLESRNEVLQYVKRTYFPGRIETVEPDAILAAAHELLIEKKEMLVDELIPSSTGEIRLRDQQHLIFP